jgi:cysteine desulfurase / selenocysteine lyase
MAERFDLAAIRREFPVTKRMIYLDSAHQTPLAARVKAALENFYTESYENGGPKSIWLKRVEQVRARIARFVGAEPGEIAFTKNTSEGLNIAANALPLQRGDNVLMIDGDHPNNAYAFLHLRRKGVEVRFLPLTGETATAETFRAAIDDRTRAISLSHVTFHAGHRFDIADISALCQQKGLYLIIDAMQSVGVLPLDVKAVKASMVAFGCHKGLMVPQGLGILYSDKTLTNLEPTYLAAASLANPPADLIARADNTELREGAGRFEIGNFNLPAIHALSEALEFVEGIGVGNIEEHVLALGDYLIERADAMKIRLVGPRLRAHRSHIYVLDLPGEGWFEYFAGNNVRVSPERDGIRVSFAMFNTKDEIDQFFELTRRRYERPAGAEVAMLVG